MVPALVESRLEHVVTRFRDSVEGRKIGGIILILCAYDIHGAGAAMSNLLPIRR